MTSLLAYSGPAYPVLCGTHSVRLPRHGLGFFIPGGHRLMVAALRAARSADQRGHSVTPAEIKRSSLRTSSASFSAAHCESVISTLLVASGPRLSSLLVAPTVCRGAVQVQQKGQQVRVHHDHSFAPTRPVTQPVTSSSFPMGATMENHLQREIPLLQRINGPDIVPPELLRTARSYRDACRVAWQLRRTKNLTFRQLAIEADLVFQHVGDYFCADDQKHRRSLPGGAVAAVESVLGNSAISQWHAAQAGLTVLEELQAMRRAS